MAVSNYSALIATKSTPGSLCHWLNSDAVPVTTIISDAQAEIWRRLRVRQMLATTTGSMSVGSNTITLPADYIAARSIVYTGTYKDYPLKRVQPEDVENSFMYDNGGAALNDKPRAFYVLASTVQLNCPADVAYPYRMLYFAEPAVLAVSTNETNFLTDRMPRLLRAMCMAYGNEWLKSAEERAYWLQIAGEMIETLNTEADFEMRNAELIVRPE